MNAVTSAFVIAASVMALLAGFAGFLKWSIRKSDNHTRDLFEPIRRRIVAEFGPNSGGMREALNLLDAKVDAGFAEAKEERLALSERVQLIENHFPPGGQTG